MGASNLPKRIVLKGSDDDYEEAIASGVIVPGELIKLTSGGTNDLTQDSGKDRRVVVETGVGVSAEALFALEDALQGKTIDDAYAIGDRVFYYIAERGDVIYAFLAAGNTTNVGDQLVPSGAGHLQPEAGSEAGQTRLAVAMEAIDNSHSQNAAGKRIKIRIL
jgi:hypothetical protein